MTQRLMFVALAFSVWTTLTAAPASATEVFVNGVKVTDLRNTDLTNCQVKFDAAGNIHIISPGYRVLTDQDGTVRVVGESDMAAAGGTGSARVKSRYVLTYTPNPKVNFEFEVFVNGETFRKIGLEEGAFGVELTQKLRPGNNIIRVVGKPGSAPPNGTETDIATLRILRGDERQDGAFVAKTPATWEFVRAAIDRAVVDRTFNVTAE